MAIVQWATSFESCVSWWVSQSLLYDGKTDCPFSEISFIGMCRLSELGGGHVKQVICRENNFMGLFWGLKRAAHNNKVEILSCFRWFSSLRFYLIERLILFEDLVFLVLNLCTLRWTFLTVVFFFFLCLTLPGIKGELRISVLPTHLSYDAPWPVRKVPLRCTPHFVAYNRESKVWIGNLNHFNHYSLKGSSWPFMPDWDCPFF